MVLPSAKAKEVTSGVFGTLAKCVKNLNPKEDPTLISDVVAELKKVDGKHDTRLVDVLVGGYCKLRVLTDKAVNAAFSTIFPSVLAAFLSLKMHTRRCCSALRR